MGVNLNLDGSPQGIHSTGLCTNHGLTQLYDWIGSLPEKTYPAILEFAARGYFKPTDTLADQLNAAIIDHPPDDPESLDTANRLADMLGEGHPEESVSVS